MTTLSKFISLYTGFVIGPKIGWRVQPGFYYECTPEDSTIRIDYHIVDPRPDIEFRWGGKDYSSSLLLPEMEGCTTDSLYFKAKDDGETEVTFKAYPEDNPSNYFQGKFTVKIDFN